MKIIEIYLNIYYKKEMPEYIKYNRKKYKWNESHKDYMAKDGLFLLHNITPFELDETVKIITVKER